MLKKLVTQSSFAAAALHVCSRVFLVVATVIALIQFTSLLVCTDSSPETSKYIRIYT